MAAIAEPKIKPRSMIPVFELPAADGQNVSIWKYKGRKHMVIAFFPAECPVCTEFLHTVVNAYHQYEEEKAVFLPIIVGSREQAAELMGELDSPYPILFDEHGKVAERFTDRVPAVFVADKFGELYAEWIGDLPTQKQILDVLELINLECPE